MSKQEIYLSLTLEGEQVDVRTVQSTLSDFQTTLQELEKGITHEEAKINWRWDDDATLCAVASPNGVRESTIRAVAKNVRLGFERIVQAKGEQPVSWPEPYGERAQKALKRIVRQLPKLDSITVEIEGGQPLLIREASLKEDFKGKDSGYTEFTSIDGVLDLVSTRGRPHFSIEEHGSGQRIRCSIQDNIFDRAKNGLGKRVVMEGEVKFRSDGTPISAKNITDIFIREQPQKSIDDLIGSLPHMTGGVPAGAYIRQLRGDEEE